MNSEGTQGGIRGGDVRDTKEKGLKRKGIRCNTFIADIKKRELFQQERGGGNQKGFLMKGLHKPWYKHGTWISQRYWEGDALSCQKIGGRGNKRGHS